ncbi:DUF1648 domain-containing protein [Youngiibacter multivorans]|uniref:Membrane protein n=1 Tax=Youngiibacter multivorans TaxID=937251 RepID=A0ABS4G1S8_9CLOT|nr:DUF1648 domain-containing protein [Youngiibacter multivorans]MBP1918481.1 putative membrane protein [Youngiibacter multivorans]
MEIISALLLCLFISYIALSWYNLPDLIPGHYNAFGEIDRWGPKAEILFLPAVTLFVFFILTLISHYPSLWNVPRIRNEENAAAVYSCLKTMLVLLKLEIIILFFYLSSFSVSGKNLPASYLPVLLLVTLSTTAYFTVKSYRLAGME